MPKSLTKSSNMLSDMSKPQSRPAEPEGEAQNFKRDLFKPNFFVEDNEDNAGVQVIKDYIPDDNRTRDIEYTKHRFTS